MFLIRGYGTIVSDDYIIHTDQYEIDEDGIRIDDPSSFSGASWDAGDLIIELPWATVRFVGVLEVWDWIERIGDFIFEHRDEPINLDTLRESKIAAWFPDFDFKELKIERTFHTTALHGDE